MDSNQFDSLVRAFVTDHSRRGLARLIAGLGAGSLLASLLEAGSVTLGKKKGKGKGKGRGKGKGKKKRPNCRDKKRNGGETDVDCGGPKCKRCEVNQTCNAPGDCVSARCLGGACAVCANNLTDCGIGPDGLQCACRQHVSGLKYCTNANGRPSTAACADCTGGEQCFVAGADFECVQPCGA